MAKVNAEPINAFLNEAAKTAEARVAIIRAMAEKLGPDQLADVKRSLCVYDRNILRLDLEGED